MALETLEILIEADRSGLESQLKRAGQSIQQFVGSMNRQEVSWTQILSKSITPALMASIASTFAIAITQALQFQSAVQEASLSTKDSFADNSAKMSDSIYGMSAATGQSANDIAGAMGIVGQVFKDTSTAQGMLNVISQEAFIRHQNVLDVAKELVPLFQQWGITSAPKASEAMAALNASVKEGSINFSDLVEGLTNSGVALHKYIDLASAAAQTELISVAPGMDAATALQGLKATATAIQQPLSQAGVLLGNMATIVTKGGMTDAFATIADKIQSAGNLANELYGSIGLDTNAVSHFKQTSVADIEAVAAAASVLIQRNKDLSVQVSDNTTSMDQFKKAWALLIADVERFVVPPALKDMKTVLDGITYAIELLNDPMKVFKETLAGLKEEGIKGFFADVSHKLVDFDNAITFGAFSKLTGLKGSDDKDSSNSSPGNMQVNHINVNVSNPSGDPNVAGNKAADSLLTSLKSAAHL